MTRFGDRLAWAISNNEAIRTQAALARLLGVTPPYIAGLIRQTAPPGKRALQRLSAAVGVPEVWLAYGGSPAGDGQEWRQEEETPEQAVGQTEGEAWLEQVVRVVRLVGGKEHLTTEDRRGLQKDILNTYIDDRRARGLEAGPLYELLGRLERGEL